MTHQLVRSSTSPCSPTAGPRRAEQILPFLRRLMGREPEPRTVAGRPGAVRAHRRRLAAAGHHGAPGRGAAGAPRQASCRSPCACVTASCTRSRRGRLPGRAHRPRGGRAPHEPVRLAAHQRQVPHGHRGGRAGVRAAAAPSRCSRAGTPTPTSSRPSPATPPRRSTAATTASGWSCSPRTTCPPRPSGRATPTWSSCSRPSRSSSPASCPATGSSASRARGAAAASGWSPRSPTWSARSPGRAGRRSSWCRSGSSATTSRRSTTSTSCSRAQIEALGMEYRRADPPNDSPQFIKALADVVVQYLGEPAGAAPGEAAARPAHATSVSQRG